MRLTLTGEIFILNTFGVQRYFISSAELMNEVCDEKRFEKAVAGPLQQVRNGAGNGLFTAFNGEHDWEIAHRVMVPAFGPLGIKNMYDEMYDLATQLVAKWARNGDQRIETTNDFTRLTLDSIALCVMDKRFNSFYSEKMHPFLDAMVNFLSESGRRSIRTRFGALLNSAADRQYWADINYMRNLAQDMINHRRANPTDKKDLLNAMLFGKDPKTGEKMTDESLINNIITFLIAGHETTSGMLSFVFYRLCKNPEVMRKAQQEVDTVVGKQPITFQHMSRLPYIEACMREALRLNSPAPAVSFKARPEMSGPVVLGGKYTIPHGIPIIAVLQKIGRDPAVYGEDAEEFKPERMHEDNFKKVPPSAWKPFGNGARGCIGRPFAWQEAILAIAMILQNFNIRMDDPSYQLQIKQTLTVKPDNFFIRARLRDGIDPISLEKKLYSNVEDVHKKDGKPVAKAATGSQPMLVLYGSNAGTCEGLAQNVANSAGSRGFNATVKSLDVAVDQLPKNQPIVIISSSYEGNPPDNAASFVEWLSRAKALPDVQCAVFGCGHHDWVSTFHKIPKLINSTMANLGVKAITEIGLSDVAEGNVLDDFDAWLDNKLWPALAANVDNSEEAEGLDVVISTNTRSSHLRHNVQDAIVVQNELLTPAGPGEKRHAEFKLPTGMSYEAGDYLAVLPVNNKGMISRVLRRFGLPWDAFLTLGKDSHSTIPTETALPVVAVLGAYVELSTPASRKNIASISRYAEQQKIKLEIRETAVSVLEILEQHPSFELPFGVYLSMLPPMRIRQYSISSSPLSDPTKVSITYSVHESGKHLGVATNYLKSLEQGFTAQVMVKPSHKSFHLPLDTKTPIIMVCAGSGLAPFYGFIHERAIRKSTGAEIGETVIFIGCRYGDRDRIYAERLDQWATSGLIKLFYAFSKEPERSEGCTYVQDRVWAEKSLVEKLFKDDARVYICGSGAVGKGVGEIAAKIRVESMKAKGEEVSHADAIEWWEKLRGERYAVDVFS
jgi:cytochrome P450 / NADPH-cytochrome P450 reductase